MSARAARDSWKAHVKVSTLALCRQAQNGGYAVPAINVFDEYSMRSVVSAAVETKSPMIVQVSVKTLRLLGVELTTAMFDAIAGPAPVPIALNLDHCPDRTLIESVVKAEWSSVLFDASELGLEDAERQTREVVALAHAHGVDVESEIENIVGVEDGIGSDVPRHSYSVQQLADVGSRTGADLLAPQVGTAHGLYRTTPNLLPERAAELRRASGRPVVLHGGTGLSDDQFRSFIAAGVSKINISTALKQVYMRAGLEHLRRCEESGKWEPTNYFADVERVATTEMKRYPVLFRSTGRA